MSIINLIEILLGICIHPFDYYSITKRLNRFMYIHTYAHTLKLKLCASYKRDNKSSQKSEHNVDVKVHWLKARGPDKFYSPK